ncbi:MAG: Ig-like domain-containing protein [Defluviitaleaceae bacterium]|nr:Ig-like domain-containing protein [Defluviitaleaceae bacterium]
MRSKLQFKKVVAVVLTLMMAMGLFPVVAMADDNGVVPRSTFADFTQPENLQRHSQIPDLLVMWDGTPVTTPEQWEERRQEIRSLLEFYFYGPVRITPNYVGVSSVAVNPGAGGAQNVVVTLEGGADAQNFATGVSTTGATPNLASVAITVPEGEPPVGGWPLIIGQPHSAAFWHARGFATAGVPTARAAHDALFGPRLNTVWYRNTGAYAIAAWNIQMLINGLRVEAASVEPRININPDRVAISGASTNGKRAAAVGAMAECVWLSIPGAGGTGAANMYRQNSAGTVWNLYSGPSTLEGSPGGGVTGGQWGPIGLAESWGGHAGWDGNYGGHYRNIPHNMNPDFAPIDIHFVAAMYARADGGKFFMPATGVAMENTNGVPGIQQMIDHALPAFQLAGVPHNLGARVTRMAHGVDFEATAVILATIDYVEGVHPANNGYINWDFYFDTYPDEQRPQAFSAAVQSYIRSLNFNIAHMHITPFMSAENAETWARIQPCCNADCTDCTCLHCPHTADGLCCDPGVPPIDPDLDVTCVIIDFAPGRMGERRRGLGWSGGPFPAGGGNAASGGTVNAHNRLQQAFSNWGGGVLFTVPLGEAKLGNFDMLIVDLLVSASSGAATDGPLQAVFDQSTTNDALFPGSGNWMDGGLQGSVRMARPFGGVGNLTRYTFDLTTPFNDAYGHPLPELERGITNAARWTTGDIALALGRNVNSQTLQFNYIRLRAIGCEAECCVPAGIVGGNVYLWPGMVADTASLEVAPAAAAPYMTWRTSNPAVATVDHNGVVTAVSAGTTVITASNTYGNDTITVTVLELEDNENVRLWMHGGAVLEAPFAASGATWSSSNESVAVVNADGNIVALSAGTAVISFAGPGGAISVNVRVSNCNPDCTCRRTRVCLCIPADLAAGAVAPLCLGLSIED